MSLQIDSSVLHQRLQIPKDGMKIQPEAKIMVSGSSGCGKTLLTTQIIKEREKLFQDPNFSSIIYSIPPQSASLVNHTLTELRNSVSNLIIYQGLPPPEIIKPKSFLILEGTSISVFLYEQTSCISLLF